MLALRRLVVLETTGGRMIRPLNRLALRSTQTAAAKAFVALLHPETAAVTRSR